MEDENDDEVWDLVLDFRILPNDLFQSINNHTSCEVLCGGDVTYDGDKHLNNDSQNASKNNRYFLRSFEKLRCMHERCHRLAVATWITLPPPSSIIHASYSNFYKNIELDQSVSFSSCACILGVSVENNEADLIAKCTSKESCPINNGLGSKSLSNAKIHDRPATRSSRRLQSKRQRSTMTVNLNSKRIFKPRIWHTCEACQKLDFGGWPFNHERVSSTSPAQPEITSHQLVAMNESNSVVSNNKAADAGREPKLTDEKASSPPVIPASHSTCSSSCSRTRHIRRRRHTDENDGERRKSYPAKNSNHAKPKETARDSFVTQKVTAKKERKRKRGVYSSKLSPPNDSEKSTIEPKPNLYECQILRNSSNQRIQTKRTTAASSPNNIIAESNRRQLNYNDSSSSPSILHSLPDDILYSILEFSSPIGGRANVLCNSLAPLCKSICASVLGRNFVQNSPAGRKHNLVDCMQTDAGIFSTRDATYAAFNNREGVWSLILNEPCYLHGYKNNNNRQGLNKIEHSQIVPPIPVTPPHKSSLSASTSVQSVIHKRAKRRTLGRWTSSQKYNFHMYADSKTTMYPSISLSPTSKSYSFLSPSKRYEITDPSVPEVTPVAPLKQPEKSNLPISNEVLSLNTMTSRILSSVSAMKARVEEAHIELCGRTDDAYMSLETWLKKSNRPRHHTPVAAVARVRRFQAQTYSAHSQKSFSLKRLRAIFKEYGGNDGEDTASTAISDNHKRRCLTEQGALRIGTIKTDCGVNLSQSQGRCLTFSPHLTSTNVSLSCQGISFLSQSNSNLNCKTKKNHHHNNPPCLLFNRRSPWGSTFLIDIIGSHNVDHRTCLACVKYLVEYCGAPVNLRARVARAPESPTFKKSASKKLPNEANGNTSQDNMIQKGSHDDDMTPLFLASLMGRPTTLEYLLCRGAFPNVICYTSLKNDDDDGWYLEGKFTPLGVAIELLNNGGDRATAETNITDSGGDIGGLSGNQHHEGTAIVIDTQRHDMNEFAERADQRTRTASLDYNSSYKRSLKKCVDILASYGALR